MPSVRRPALLAAGLLLAVAAPLAAAPPASAHDELVATVPEKGSTLTQVPASVEITFSDEVESLGAAVVVTDSAGARVADGKPVVSGTTVTQALLPDVAAGTVTVAYRIVSGDGHPVSGTWTFELDVAGPTSTPSASPASPASSSAPPASPAATEVAASPAASTSSGSGAPVGVVVGIVILAAAGVAAVALLVRRGRGSQA